MNNNGWHRLPSEISKLIIGQTMTIEDGSSLSQSETHLAVFQNIVESDCDFIREFERDNGSDVMLQYRTSNDDRVRPEHAALHNTTLPLEDPFWNSYLPPLGWNCRCTTVMVRAKKFPMSDSEEAIRKGEKATAGPKLAIFRFNPGKTGKVFPPKHPYLPKGCGACDKNLRLAYNPNSEKCRACKHLHDCLLGEKSKQGLSAEYKHKIYSKPLSEQFISEVIGKGIGKEHVLVCRNNFDYPNVRAVMECFAQSGHEVFMNPEIVRYETLGRRVVYPNFPQSVFANPDLYIKGIGYVDVKSPKYAKNIVNNANKACEKQKSIVCITDLMIDDLTDDIILSKTAEIFKSKLYTFDTVYWYVKSTLIKYDRQDL